jgi:tRNA (cmo5U34)-methyltransferase
VNSPRQSGILSRLDTADVGDGLSAVPAGWSFGGDTPKHFDSHIARSIPNYAAGHRLIEQVSDFFVRNDSVIYDIGTSTGSLLRRLSERHPAGARWIGIDVEDAMINHARAEQAARGSAGNVEYIVADACDVGYEPCDLVISYYTMQFVRPRRRQDLFNAIYRALNWGGAFLLFEKVRAPDARFQDIASALYVDYKLGGGYAASEILGKARSLKSVLEPFSTQGNLDMLTRAGFLDIMTIYKHICFEGFLAIK